MTKDPSPYQQRQIRAFYRNRDAKERQRLGELVTEIYLAGSDRTRDRLWARVAAILERAPDVERAEAERIVAHRDVEALAALAGARFEG